MFLIALAASPFRSLLQPALRHDDVCAKVPPRGRWLQPCADCGTAGAGCMMQMTLGCEIISLTSQEVSRAAAAAAVWLPCWLPLLPAHQRLRQTCGQAAPRQQIRGHRTPPTPTHGAAHSHTHRHTTHAHRHLDNTKLHDVEMLVTKIDCMQGRIHSMLQQGVTVTSGLPIPACLLSDQQNILISLKA